MKTQLFVYSNVRLESELIKAVDSNKVDLVNFSDTNKLASFYKNNYTRIGFLWDNTYSFIPFGTTKYNNFKYFKKELVEYLSKYNELNVPIVVDLITCSMKSFEFINEVNVLKQVLQNVQIEYSLNPTGSVPNSDWIMESNNVSIKNEYFNDNINGYKFYLGVNFQYNALITYDHDLYLCGLNINGQLGLGIDTDFEPTFKKITKWNNPNCLDIDNKKSIVTAVSCGFMAIGVIRNDSLYMIGLNNDVPNGSNVSYLGLTIFDTYVRTFTKVTTGLPQDKKVIAVSCGSSHTMAIMCDGSLYACGVNNANVGELGFGITTETVFSTFTRVPLPSNLKVLAVSCADQYSAIICTNGTKTSLYTCGLNNYGNLGLGDFDNRSSFTQVTLGIPQNINVASVSCGSVHMVVLLNNGAVYSCGLNNDGELGNGTFIDSNILLEAKSGLPNSNFAIGINAGNETTAVILQDGSLYVCGFNGFGNLGLGTQVNASSEPSFKKVILGLPFQNAHESSNQFCNEIYIPKKVVGVSTNFVCSTIVLDDGSVYTTGTNINGILGQALQSTTFPDGFTSIYNKVKFALDQNTEIRAITTNDWNFIFLVNEKLKDCCEKIHANNYKCLSIVTNYQNYEIIIENDNAVKKIIGCKFLLDINTHKIIKKGHVYQVTIIDLNNNLVVYKFDLIFC